MKNPLVSIVIPIYNVEEYLDRCILSVVNQSYREMEIILVDDGSPDRCPQMCDDWAQKDTRIKVIHKENAGLGFARNTGIEHATGAYIFFFDSDDYVEPNTVEACVRIAMDNNADIVCFGNDVQTHDGTVLTRRIPTPPKFIYSGEEVREVMMPNVLSYNSVTGEDWNFTMSACFSMYSMEVVRKSGWRFVSERDIMCEDIYSVLEFYQYVRKAVILPDVLYHYITNPRSLSRSYREDRYEKLKYFAHKLTELSKKMNSERQLKDRISRIFLGLTIGAMKQIVAADVPLMEKLQAIKQILIDDYMQQVFLENDFSKEAITKKTLFWTMEHKYVMACCGIIFVRNQMDRY